MDATPPARPVWHWALLLVPTLEMMIVTLVAQKFWRGYDGLGGLEINLVVFALLCLGLGVWFASRLETARERFIFGIVDGLGLLVLNLLLSYAGCALIYK